MFVFNKASVVALLALFVMTACASGGVTKDESGVLALGKLRVTLGPGWQRVTDDVPERKDRSRVYSRDGLDSDRLILVPTVAPGDALFNDVTGRGLPVFQLGASQADIADLVADSIQAALWGGGATVEASNVKAHGFTGIPGVVFDLDADLPDAAKQRGMAGAFVHEERLHVTIFLAESPGAYELHREHGQAVIDSMVMTMKTIRTAGY
jgi:hypothetical protein